jgi:L-lactate dehydrogenase
LSHVEVELWPKEQQALQASARALQETFGKVKAA